MTQKWVKFIRFKLARIVETLIAQIPLIKSLKLSNDQSKRKHVYYEARARYFYPFFCFFFLRNILIYSMTFVPDIEHVSRCFCERIESFCASFWSSNAPRCTMGRISQWSLQTPVLLWMLSVQTLNAGAFKSSYFKFYFRFLPTRMSSSKQSARALYKQKVHRCNIERQMVITCRRFSSRQPASIVAKR